jgi:N-acetylglucosamine-6-phosphate deacetylase
MTDTLLIINAQVPGYQGNQQIFVQAGVIAAIAPMTDPLITDPLLPDGPIMDVEQDWISLGGVDLQINGALGLAFPDLSQANVHQLEGICQYLWAQGVDGFLPTIVTTSVAKIQQALATIAQFLSAPPGPTARILGVHLEGPFLSPQKRGAHPAEHILPLTVDWAKRVLGDYASIIKVITLAPELDPTGAAIDYLRSQNIIVSLGHSQATAAQADQAFAQGATMVTHAFNAMPSLHHREPGLLGAAIRQPQVRCGLIADGQHVSPIMMDILLRASDYDRGIFLVSDALAPLGLPDGIYPWDERQIEVKQGTARLLDGTLAGTTLPLLVGVQNLVEWEICDLGRAIALATITPRQALVSAAGQDAVSNQGLWLHQLATLLRWQVNPTSGRVDWVRLSSKVYLHGWSTS